MPTAFRGGYGEGKPVIAILAEYDALPQLGHACGHNLIAASAVGYLISSFMKGGTGALVFTFAFLFLILAIVDSVCSVALVKPDFSLNFAAGAITYIMQTPYPTDYIQVFPEASIEIGVYFPEPYIAAIVAIVYSVVGIVVGLYFFKRKEMSA